MIQINVVTVIGGNEIMCRNVSAIFGALGDPQHVFVKTYNINNEEE